MSAFVVLSVTLAVAIVALTVVMALRLARVARHGAASAQASLARLRPLSEELGDEVAVTQTELDHLQRRLARLGSPDDGDARASGARRRS